MVLRLLVLLLILLLVLLPGIPSMGMVCGLEVSFDLWSVGTLDCCLELRVGERSGYPAGFIEDKWTVGF